MALGNYTWQMRPGDRNRFKPNLYDESGAIINMGQDLGTAQINADQGSGIVYPQYDSGLHVKTETNIFTRRHSGRFTFIFGDEFIDSTTGGQEVQALNESTFRFYKQVAGTDWQTGGNYFQFRVYQNRPPNGNPFVQMQLEKVIPPSPGYDSLTFPFNKTAIFYVNTLVIPTGPWCAGIEWTTNGASQDNLSHELTAPSFPELQFGFRFDPTGIDPLAAPLIACINIDLSFLQNVDPDDSFKTATALSVFGAGFYDILSDIDTEWKILTLQSSPAQAGYLSQISQLGIDHKAAWFQDRFALNEGRESEGFAPGNDGVSGLINPVEAEDWTVDGACIGWDYSITGWYELTDPIILEKWEIPNFGFAADEITTNGEGWEPPVLSGTTGIIDESWEP